MEPLSQREIDWVLDRWAQDDLRNQPIQQKESQLSNYYGPRGGDVKSGLGWAGFIIIFLVIAFLVTVGLNAASLIYLPWQTNKVTEVYRNSNAYVDTQGDLLLKLQAAAEDPNATQAQKSANVARMKEIVARLNPDQVPAQTRAYLANK